MKKQLTPEEKYKRNQKISKILRILTPVCFWVCIAVSIICLIFAIKNSFGNIAEITSLLDSKKYTGAELQANYDFLIEKYGEWIIGNGGAGFMISFVNIKNAVFSGVLIVNIVLCIIFFVSAFLLGKWILPKISKQLLIDNQDMVNMTILKNESDSKKE